MKLGAENKKQVYILAGLSVVAAYFVYSTFLSSPSPASAPSSAPASARSAAVAEPEAQPAGPPRAPSTSGRSDEFRPKLRSKRPEDRVDPTRVDPTLRLDLVAKLQEIPAPCGSHNLFQIAPPVKAELPKGPEPVVPTAAVMGPRPLPPPPGPPPPAPPPQAVPINVKYYGWASPSGSDRRRAFFLDGDEILIGAEGDLLKKRYRVVKIGVSSVVMEDLQYKSEQTLPLEPLVV